MENKKKRRKRKILIALLLFLFTGVLFSTSTYAWFTANRAVSVEEIDVKAQASGGIQISANAVDWSNEVTIDELTAADLATKGIKNYIPKTALKPVTTIGANEKTGAFDFYSGELKKCKREEFYWH